MKSIIINKELVTRMPKLTWKKDRVRRLLVKTSVRWFNRYLPLLWDEEAM